LPYIAELMQVVTWNVTNNSTSKGHIRYNNSVAKNLGHKPYREDTIVLYQLQFLLLVTLLFQLLTTDISVLASKAVVIA